MLSGIVIRQENKINNLTKEVDWLKRELRKLNLSISGILGSSEETKSDRKEKVQSFFKDTMEIEEEIAVTQAVRVGKTGETILVKLENLEDKSLIFSNASNLKGKKNAKRRLFFVNDYISETEREQRKYFQHLQWENNLKEEEERLKIQLKRGNLYANNTLVKQKVQTPEAVDVLTLKDNEIEALQKVKTYEAGVHEEKGSEFFCHFQRINSVEEVQNGLTKM